MKVIMTGGGTGGHIYPAIAIADEIKKRFPDAEILFVGAKRGLDGMDWQAWGENAGICSKNIPYFLDFL